MTHSGGDRVELWYKVAPLTGANNIVVSLPSSVHLMAGATSWTGVHQTTPLGTAGNATGTSSTATANVTTVSRDALVDPAPPANGDRRRGGTPGNATADPSCCPHRNGHPTPNTDTHPGADTYPDTDAYPDAGPYADTGPGIHTR